MKKKQKKGLYGALAVGLLAVAGYQGYQSGFYKSAYDGSQPTEQTVTQPDKQEGKEYKSTGDASLLDVKLPERLDNETVHYKSIVVYFNKYYRVPNCVAYELTNTMTSMADSRDAENRANYKFERDHNVKGCAALALSPPCMPASSRFVPNILPPWLRLFPLASHGLAWPRTAPAGTGGKARPETERPRREAARAAGLVAN